MVGKDSHVRKQAWRKRGHWSLAGTPIAVRHARLQGACPTRGDRLLSISPPGRVQTKHVGDPGKATAASTLSAIFLGHEGDKASGRGPDRATGRHTGYWYLHWLPGGMRDTLV